MWQSFIQEEMARQHSEALSIAAQRAAESARYRTAQRERSRVRVLLGTLLVRAGLRLTGERGSAEPAGELNAC